MIVSPRWTGRRQQRCPDELAVRTINVSLFSRTELPGEKVLTALVVDSAKLASDLVSACAEQLDPPIRPEVEIVEVDGKQVVAASVEELPPTQKRCFVKTRGVERGSVVRTFDGDRALSIYTDSDLEEVEICFAARGRLATAGGGGGRGPRTR